MKIIKTIQEEFDNIVFKSNDILIVASGYEPRCTHLFKKIKEKGIIPKTYVLSFSSKKSKVHKLNDIFYNENNCSVMDINGNSDFKVKELLRTILSENDLTENLNIYVDISSMTRIWYASILSYLNLLEKSTKIVLTFFYSISKFMHPKNSQLHNIHVQPVQDFSNLSIPDKPTALVIGLGYEKNRAFGLRESLDAEELYLFCTDQNSSKEYYTEVLTQNKEMLFRTNPNNIIYYPLKDLKYTESLLTDICTRVTEKFRIIIAPCGPKLFTLLSFVIAINLEDIDVWRISAGDEAEPVEKIATGEIIAFKLIY